MSTKWFAEFNVELTKYITSTLANATALKASTLSKVFALNANQEKPTTNIPRPAALFLAKESMNTIPPSPRHVSATQNTSESEVFAPDATLDTIMIAIQINAFASLDISKRTASVTQYAPLTRPTSMEDASATMAYHSITENVFVLSFVL